MGTGSSKVKRIALSGILAALVVITLLLAVVMPTGRLSLYALSSIYISIVIIEYGVGNGWFFYAASSLVSLIIVPDKLGFLPYLLFFGIYGIIKYYIERIKRLPFEYLLKLLYFNLTLGVSLVIVKEILLEGVEVNVPWWLLILGFEVVFVIYDYVYTLFIQYYRDRLRNLIKLH